MGNICLPAGEVAIGRKTNTCLGFAEGGPLSTQAVRVKNVRIRVATRFKPCFTKDHRANYNFRLDG